MPALDSIGHPRMFYNLPGKAVFIQRLHERVRVELFDIKYAAPFQTPVSTIIAPIIAGTPVV